MNKSPIAIIYSGSLTERDYLRQQVGACGLSPVCFEKENTCIDNLKSIQPAMVIVQTENQDCVWRFIFSLHLSGLLSPLLVLSERLNAKRFEMMGIAVPVHSFSDHLEGGKLQHRIKVLMNSTGDRRGGNRANLLVGVSEDITKIRAKLPSLSRSCDPILITGERGTGKELISRLIAQNSNGRNDIIKIDCSGLEPQGLINGSLQKIFGLINGSGLITVMLDKIHTAPLETQADLLLLVEEARRILDSDRAELKIGIRFIATSENNLEELAKSGAFRKDLYYRLNVIPLFLSPIRDRKMDIALLMDYFIIDACMKNNRCIVIPSNKARETLYAHNWPGNADELGNYMKRMSADGHESCIFNNNRIQNPLNSSGVHILKATSMEDLPKDYEIKEFIPTVKNLSLRSICDEFVARTERKLMKRALESTNWNRKKAAELLNISYKSMLNKIKAYDII